MPPIVLNWTLFNLALTTCSSPCEAQKRQVISFPSDLFDTSFFKNFILESFWGFSGWMKFSTFNVLIEFTVYTSALLFLLLERNEMLRNK